MGGAIAKLKPRVNVIGIVPATENMPSGCRQHPARLKTMLGKTIEVVNTDAEGRLVLADAIAYAREQGATSVRRRRDSQGAISVALGNVAMGVMGNNGPLIGRIKAASAATGEKVWELPMWDEYFELIKSDVADMKNSGGRPAGSITAAMLLREFAEDTPWAHLDIAGVDTYDSEKGARVKGASGIPVRTLVELVLQSQEKSSPEVAEGGVLGATHGVATRRGRAGPSRHRTVLPAVAKVAPTPFRSASRGQPPCVPDWLHGAHRALQGGTQILRRPSLVPRGG
jgi:leucyl aminopeptidase